jgi:hypothetical protein
MRELTVTERENLEALREVADMTLARLVARHAEEVARKEAT